MLITVSHHVSRRLFFSNVKNAYPLLSSVSDVANAKATIFRAARTVLSVARPCTISGDILSTPLSYPQSPKLNDPYLMIKLRKSLLLNARRRLCVRFVCFTLLFMRRFELLD